MARTLFNGVLVSDKQVVSVRPKKELEPFFKVSYECQEKSLAGDPDRIRTVKTDFSVNIEPPVPLRRHEATGSRYLYQSRAKLRDDQIEKIRQFRDAGYSLRRLAREYGVSHETIRSALSKERLS